MGVALAAGASTAFIGPRIENELSDLRPWEPDNASRKTAWMKTREHSILTAILLLAALRNRCAATGPDSADPSTSSSPTATSSTAPARPGIRAISAFATARSPPSAICADASAPAPSTRTDGGRARFHRHAGPVGADDPGRSAPAVEDLSGHHHRDHRRRRLRRAAERRHHPGRPVRVRSLSHHARLADLSAVLRPPGKAGHGHQPRQLCRRHAGPAHGAGR